MSHKLRILYIVRDPPGFGGAELRLLQICQWLAAQGHTVRVVCGKTKAGMPAFQTIENVQFVYKDLVPAFLFRFDTLSFYLSRYLFYPLTLFWGGEIKKFQPDVIVDYVTPAPSLLYVWAKRWRIPIVGSIMEYRTRHLWQEVSDPATAIFGYVAQNLFFRRFNYDQIVTGSQATRQQLLDGGFDASQIEVVLNGVNIQQFASDQPTNQPTNQLIFVSRLMPQKGHRYLLEAVALATKQVPNLQLTIVGGGPIRAQLSAQAEALGIAGISHFTGRVSDAEKVAHLHQSTLFVMPSLQEGFGIVLLEAMAAGLPIVAFDLPVYREFMDDQCAIFVPKLDVAKMAAAIVQLLEDEECRHFMSTYNQKRAQQFTWAAAAQQKERVLLRTASSKATK